VLSEILSWRWGVGKSLWVWRRAYGFDVWGRTCSCGRIAVAVKSLFKSWVGVEATVKERGWSFGLDLDDIEIFMVGFVFET